MLRAATGNRSEETMAHHLRADHGARAEAGAFGARRHLAGDDRGALQALPGIRQQAERDPREARRRRSLEREPGLLRAPLAEGRPDLRDRRDQEPRDLLRAPRRHRRRPDRRLRRPVKRDFGSVDAWQGRPEGDRAGRPRLGVDGVRLGRGPALQLHRRRAEHVPGLERDRRSSRSTSTSTRTSSTSAPTAPPTSTSSSTTSTTTW